MKSIHTFFLFSFVCLLMSCAKDDIEVQPVIDNDGPEIYNIVWVDHPSLANDPSGPIVDGGNYVISIKDGFQFKIDVKDASNVGSGSVYLFS